MLLGLKDRCFIGRFAAHPAVSSQENSTSMANIGGYCRGVSLDNGRQWHPLSLVCGTSGD